MQKEIIDTLKDGRLDGQMASVVGYGSTLRIRDGGLSIS